MASGIFGSTLMGLNAAKANLNVTALNISNVNTTGYHRQTTSQVTQPSTTNEYGAVGSGVAVVNVDRAYSSFLDNQVYLSQGQLSNYQTYSQYASQVGAILGSQTSTFADAMSSFFSSMQDVANDPTSVVARQSMLFAGSNLAGQFNNLSNSLSDMAQSVNQQVQVIASQVNSYAQGIAALNQQIAIAQASSQNGTSNTNSLMDQRDALVTNLNKLVNVTAVNQAGSGYNLYFGNGQPLVVGSQANAMVALANPSDPTQLQPGLQIGNTSQALQTSQITGGQLGGLLAFRDQMLVPTQRELGKIAYAVTTAVNGQNAAGYDLYGNAGGNLFSPPQVQAPIANTANTGNGALNLSITDANRLANSDYRLSYDGANYTLTRLSDNTAYSNASLAGLSALAQAGEGFSLNLSSGTIAAGDSYTIRPTQYSAAGLSMATNDPNLIAAAAVAGSPGDNSNVLAMAGLQSQKLLLNGTSTLQSTFTQLVGRNAILQNTASNNAATYQTLTNQATQAQQSFSGVNLDEEAANLIQYQQAYQAAAKALQVSSTLFSDILSALQ
jgi:flagellar hook-associated protein 1 FlgK